MTKYVGALDQGTTSTRFMIFDHAGQVVAIDQMEHEQIYRHDDLKLEEVASMLYITPHQLSEFVNDQMGMNYASYINQFRVDEAKHLLVSEPEMSTLMIAFEVGFGSKQSFNKIFKNQTGLTPSGYRNQEKGKLKGKSL